jgi:hypothetical protein
MVFKYLIDEQTDGDFDVVSCLEDINPIIHVKVALMFHRNLKFVVDHVEEDVHGFSIWNSNSKVVHLMFEENTVSMDDSRIKARFMYGWLETKFAEDRVGMFLPKAGRFRVSLHCQQYWDDVTIRDGRASLVLDPPFVKGLVRANEEALLGWRGFDKGV